MSFALTRALRVLAHSVVPLGLRQFAQRRNLSAATGLGSSRSVGNQLHGARPFFEPLEERAMMSTTYYVNNNGSDNNSGTSINAPLKSISKINSKHLNPGDRVLFQSGQTFNGGLNVAGDGGSASNPVVFSSYGSGRATIYSGQGRGAYVLNSSGITFDNLKFQGSPGDIHAQDGIRIENYSANTVKSGFLINNCDISGYAEGGIIFGSDSTSEGLNNLSITNNNIYNNVMTGIESYAVTTHGMISTETNTNILISNNQVHNNYGDGKSFNTGNGIMLQGLNGAMVEYNSAYENGAIGGNGGVGIWAYSSNKVIFQYNQSYNNKTTRSDDGDGFDFDADTSNSTMQYNLAYGNDGGGFQLNQWWNDDLESGDIIRYNISQNNGRKDNYAGIDVWGKVLNAQIYNNTVYNTPAVNGQTSCIRISNNTITNLFVSNIYVANNIFVTTGGTPFVDFYSAALRGASNVVFAGNVYYSYSGASNFHWGSQYSSLSNWRASTGEEKLNGQAVGIYANPLLNSPGNATALSGTFSPSNVGAYHLQQGTPILTSGVALNSLFTIASPLTGASTGKTIPGVDQSLAGTISSGGNGTGGVSSTLPSTGGSIASTQLVGWDIGSPRAGSNTYSGSSDTITGGGGGIGGTSDSFRYAWTSLTGNGQISAQVTSLSSSTTARAGLMIRNTNTPNAAQVSLLLSPDGKTASLVSRATAGGSTTTTSIIAYGYKFIKLVRSGATYSGYISANGSSWTLVGSIQLNLGDTVSIGLAATGVSSSSMETASFISVNPIAA